MQRRLPESLRAGRLRARGQHGFSLIELMVVVAITGVLASLALPTFTGYVQRSRTSEAVQFLGVIKLRQEAYRAEFGSYEICNNISDPLLIAFWPASAATQMKNAKTYAFGINTCFSEIGAKPDAPVRFGYGWAAGPPGAMPGASATVYGITPLNQDHYFVAQAESDLDGDGIACVFELTSFTRNVWIGKKPGMTALAAGWE